VRPDDVAAGASPTPNGPPTQPSAAVRGRRAYPPVLPAPEWLADLERRYWAEVETLIREARSTSDD
jgi:hypothetical protein